MAKLDIDRLSALLRARGLKKGAFCESLGHTRTWIDDWKRGRSSPSSETVNQIAAALGTTPAYLLGETDDPAVPVPVYGLEAKKEQPAKGELPSENAEINRLFDALPTDQQQQLLDYARYLAGLQAQQDK